MRIGFFPRPVYCWAGAGVCTADSASVCKRTGCCGNRCLLSAYNLFYVSHDCISFLMSFNSRAIHNLKVPTLASVLAITVNTVLNYGLIFGNFHLPRLGVEGAAIATLTARFVEMLLILGYVISVKTIRWQLTVRPFADWMYH